MGQDIAYLVKRNGVYAAKFQKPSGSWTHHSLHTGRAAEAKLLFEQFRFDLLQKKELDLNRVVPVRLGELALLHLADVEQNQARSWHLKQRLQSFLATKASRPPSAIRIWAIPGCIPHIPDWPAF